MNKLWTSLSTITRTTLNVVNHTSFFFPTITNTSALNPVRFLTLESLHRRLKREYVKKKQSPLLGKPFAKGIVLKTLIKKPRKPNSANRKCVLVKLSIGKEMVAFVPGEGHNLQEHQTVLVNCKKLKDTPGVKIRCIRGKYDLPHVKKDKN